MAQCMGRTLKGERCKRDARAGSEYCALHEGQKADASPAREAVTWDRDTIMKTALGAALVGAILFFRIRR